MAKFGMRVNMLQDSLETPTLSHIKQLTLVEYLSFNMAERKKQPRGSLGRFKQCCLGSGSSDHPEEFHISDKSGFNARPTNASKEGVFSWSLFRGDKASFSTRKTSCQFTCHRDF